MTPPRGAAEILNERQKLDFVVNTIADRAKNHANMTAAEAEELRLKVRTQAIDLLDDWSKIAMEGVPSGVQLQYQMEVGGQTQRVILQ